MHWSSVCEVVSLLLIGTAVAAASTVDVVVVVAVAAAVGATAAAAAGAGAGAGAATGADAGGGGGGGGGGVGVGVVVFVIVASAAVVVVVVATAVVVGGGGGCCGAGASARAGADQRYWGSDTHYGRSWGVCCARMCVERALKIHRAPPPSLCRCDGGRGSWASGRVAASFFVIFFWRGGGCVCYKYRGHWALATLYLRKIPRS